MVYFIFDIMVDIFLNEKMLLPLGDCVNKLNDVLTKSYYFKLSTVKAPLLQKIKEVDSGQMQFKVSYCFLYHDLFVRSEFSILYSSFVFLLEKQNTILKFILKNSSTMAFLSRKINQTILSLWGSDHHLSALNSFFATHEFIKIHVQSIDV